MKRKVILLAGKTCVVSLPKKWTQKHGVSKGDELEVHEDHDQVVFRKPLKEQSGRKAQVDISDAAPMIKRILGALYKTGYDEFEILFKTPEELATIQEVVREEFIGFEVVHQGKKTVIARKISHVNPEEFDAVLKRMFHIITTMADESKQALDTNDKAWLKAIIMRDKDVNKLADFCRRLLSQHLVPAQHAQTYHIVETLEKIGDAYRDLCKEGLKTQLPKELGEYYDSINVFLKDFMNLYYSFTIEDVTKFGTEYYMLKKRAQSITQKLDNHQMNYWFFLNLAREHLFDMNGVLMAIKL